jgi:lipoate-protein ligase A
MHLRIIIDGPQTASFNMAADRHLLDNCKDGEYVTLRLYSWKKPSITLGCMQNQTEILDFESMKRDDIDWVIRPTGGRAVFHWEDLTYSFIFPKIMREMGTTVQESYSIISNCLSKGLELAGISCTAQDSYDEYFKLKRETKLPCFLAPNRDEIMYKGKKLIGSAQKRTAQSVLQHGSIPLTPAYRKLPLYLKLSEENRRAQIRLLEMKSISINEIDKSLNNKKLMEKMIDGFLEELKCDGKERSWSEEEIKEIGIPQNLLNNRRHAQ